MDTQNTNRQLRYLEEVRIPLQRAGFETQPLENSQIPVQWNGVPLCRITGKGSVFYRREDVNTPLAEDALLRVEDIATRIIRQPGIWVQHLTVFEPDDSMIEVAIAAVTPVLPEDPEDGRW